MAKALQTPVPGSLLGTTVVLAAPNGTGSANGDIVYPNSIVYVENGSGGSLTVTVKQPGSIDGQLVTADYAVTVATGAKSVFGPFPGSFKQLPGSTDAGYVYLEYSTVTSVTRTTIVTPW